MLKKNKWKKLIICISLFLFILLPSMSYGQILSDDITDKIIDQEEYLRDAAGFEPADETGVASVISMVIKGFLSLLGIIFVILIVSGGYNWMTAAGSEEKVTKAKDTIMRAVIGLIIVASAYAITYFVFSYLGGVSGGSGPG